MEAQDQEVTLGTGRLLGLFFGLVIVCALFFSLGFTLGRRSSTPETVAAAGPNAPTNVTDSRPSASRTGSATKVDAEAPSKSEELTFYRAVEQNAPTARLETRPSTRPAAQVTARTVESKPLGREMPRMYSAGSGYMVQVAAVTKQDDAEALVHALRRKSYPVIMTSGPADKLYHVQVGPFGDIKDAEGMRAKLIGDGYNPIVKK
jgi:cell division septation protein DedD